MFLSRTHFDLPYHLVGISVSVSIATMGAKASWFGLAEHRTDDDDGAGASRLEAAGA